MKNINNNNNKLFYLDVNNELRRDHGELKYKFRLVGVPLNQSIQMLDIDPNSSIADFKKTVIRSYKLNPIVAIQFIYQGKILPDNLKCSMMGGVYTKQDIITVMGIMGGG